MSFSFRSAVLFPLSLVFSACSMFASVLHRLLRNVVRWCNLRGLFVLNCVVLIVNLTLYALNNHLIEAPIESYFLSPLSPRDTDLLDRTFRAFVEAVEVANLTYFIYGGTLIGSLRHHNRIPWDDDVDIIMRADDRPRIKDVLSRMDPDFGVYEAGTEYYASQWKFYPTDGRYIFHRQYRTPYIDLFFYRENDTHIWNASPVYMHSELWPKRRVFPLRRRPFGALSVTAPCNGPAVMGRAFDIEVCQSRYFSHLVELPLLSSPVNIPCEQLSHLYPFVRSQKINGSSLVRETLMFGNWSVREFTAPDLC